MYFSKLKRPEIFGSYLTILVILFFKVSATLNPEQHGSVPEAQQMVNCRNMAKQLRCLVFLYYVERYCNEEIRVVIIINTIAVLKVASIANAHEE